MGRMKVEKGGKKRKSKKPKDANKPKRATSAYFFFMANCREQAKKAGKNISKVAEFTKECSEKWKNLTTTQRKPFDEKAAKDKSRYEKEMAEYKGKTQADPGKPKRPQTSYFLFLADFRKNYVPKESDKGSNSAHKILLKEAGEKWRDMASDEKKIYEAKSEEEAKKYKIAMAEYKKKSGGSVTGGSTAKKAKVEVVEEDDEEEEDEEEEEEGEPEEEEEEEDEEEEEEDDD